VDSYSKHVFFLAISLLFAYITEIARNYTVLSIATQRKYFGK